MDDKLAQKLLDSLEKQRLLTEEMYASQMHRRPSLSQKFIKNHYVSKITLADTILWYIDYCQDGIEKIIEGEKDSYIVKHDIAIKILKQMAEDLGVDIDE